MKNLRRAKYHQDAVEWLISLYEQGMTKTALARKAHISVNTIDACYKSDLMERGIMFPKVGNRKGR